MRNKKYKIHVTDRVYLWNDKDKSMDWMDGTGSDDKVVESYDTIWECLKSMEDWWSRWVMYPSVYIESEGGGEVWESTAEVNKCDKCGHEEWSNMTHSSSTPYKEFEEKVKNRLV